LAKCSESLRERPRGHTAEEANHRHRRILRARGDRIVEIEDGTRDYFSPHVHMIVPGGGISLDGSHWLSCRPRFFLPVPIFSKLFRGLMLGKLLAAHKAGQLKFFGQHVHDRKLSPPTWRRCAVQGGWSRSGAPHSRSAMVMCYACHDLPGRYSGSPLSDLTMSYFSVDGLVSGNQEPHD
jgi:hypothetical protein